VRWQAVFRATPLLRGKGKRCRPLVVTALQKNAAFVISVDFVVSDLTLLVIRKKGREK
jgi:hypothetical protein